jgi:phosphomannomutase
MALIKSISGIRGTIGGRTNDNLTPVDVVKFAAAYGSWLIEKHNGKKVVVGRDGRISGSMVSQLVINTLTGLGINVIDAGLSTTPTVEMAVVWEKADGGIIITASHNPAQWNALKLLNSRGEFISAEDGAIVLEKASNEDFEFADVSKLGTVVIPTQSLIEQHIAEILKHKFVDVKNISAKQFTVVIDAINSSGAIAVPPLLKALEVGYIIINEEVNGKFAHNPEPLPEHLVQLCDAVKQHKADLGIAVDPDVDRLCFVNEDGTLFGEEYTLVAVADYILSQQKGNTVSNLSSTKALRNITEKHGSNYYASAVGEVNVVAKMKEHNAVIGGEGNGGIIVPDLHYGRDALAGIALFLSALAKYGGSISAYRRTFPDYFMAKKKIELSPGTDVKRILKSAELAYSQYNINTVDGVKIEMEDGWVHLRSSNTEPIIRIYTEAPSAAKADALANEVIEKISAL